MEINIQNYETVLIDYFDGQLSALEVAQVLLFLEQHPEIKKEFEAFGTLPEIENTSIDNDFKQNLKKLSSNEILAEKSFNELIVAQMEGDCNQNESRIINEIIAGSASLGKLKNTFQKTKLSPDFSIIYPNKHSLKRKEARVFYLNKRYAAAATLLLLASLVFLLYRNSSQQLNEVKVAQNIIKKENSASENVTLGTDQKNSFTNESIPKNKQFASADISSKALVKSSNNVNSDTSIRRPQQLQEIPVKSLVTLKNDIALKNNSVAGSTVEVVLPVMEAPAAQENFLTLGNFIKKKFIERGKDHLIDQEKPVNQNELALDPLTVASVGADIIEKTTGKRVFLTRSFDKRGSLKSYTLAAGNFKFERIK